MSEFDSHQAVDYSRFLVHFTRDSGREQASSLDVIDSHQLAAHRESLAFDKLQSILDEGILRTSPQSDLPWRPEAACFSESVWGAFSRLTNSFSDFGVGFTKRFVFNRGGGPVFYMRGHLLIEGRDQIPSGIQPFIKPFDPDAEWSTTPSNTLFERE